MIVLTREGNRVDLGLGLHFERPSRAALAAFELAVRWWVTVVGNGLAKCRRTTSNDLESMPGGCETGVQRRKYGRSDDTPLILHVVDIGVQGERRNGRCVGVINSRDQSRAIEELRLCVDRSAQLFCVR